MEDRLQVDSVYTDFSKAFDKVDHGIMSRALAGVGVDGDLCGWLCSYLRDRSQAVILNGYISSFIQVTSGVPQGSHLGPLLFLIYINGIADCFRWAKFLLYADDCKIYMAIRNFDDCVRLQEDLDRFDRFCRNNRLFLNIAKCAKITFTRNVKSVHFDYSLSGANLESVKQIKDLGVILDEKLMFQMHIDYIANRAYSMLGFIMRTTYLFNNINCIINIYYAYVFSVINYCSAVWNPQYNCHISRLESIQRRLVRFLSKLIKLPRFEFYQNDLQFFGLISLEKRRLLNDMVILYKIVNGLVDSTELVAMFGFNASSRITRRRDLFYIPFSRTNSATNSPVTRLSRSYNRYCPLDLFRCTMPCFKVRLKYLLRNSPV